MIKTAEFGRRSDAEVIVLHIIRTNDPGIEDLREKSQRLLADIRHKFIAITGSIPEEIIRVAQDYGVAEIVIGKRGHQPWNEVTVGSVSQAVLESSPIPVILVDDDRLAN